MKLCFDFHLECPQLAFQSATPVCSSSTSRANYGLGGTVGKKKEMRPHAMKFSRALGPDGRSQNLASTCGTISRAGQKRGTKRPPERVC